MPTPFRRSKNGLRLSQRMGSEHLTLAGPAYSAVCQTISYSLSYLMTLASVALAMFVGSSMAQSAQGPDGAAIFERSCAVCHRPGTGTRAPLPDVLRQMTRESILRALEIGKM